MRAIQRIELDVGKTWSFLQSRNFDHLHISDIWLIAYKEGMLGEIIRWGTARHGDPAVYNHISGYTGSGNILEALTNVVERSGKVYFRPCFKLKIVRNIFWTQRQRSSILFQAKKYDGMPYAYGKVFILQAFDCLFRTDKFTRHFSLTTLPYCSQLWAQSVAEAGIKGRINGKHPNSVSPDDWDDEAQNNLGEWVTVLKHDGKMCTLYTNKSEEPPD